MIVKIKDTTTGFVHEEELNNINEAVKKVREIVNNDFKLYPNDFAWSFVEALPKEWKKPVNSHLVDLYCSR